MLLRFAILELKSGVGAVRFHDQGDTLEGEIKYDSTTNSMRFHTNGNTERMRIDSSGQVGMGTSSPAQQAGRGLHIHGTDQARLKLTNTASTATANDGFDIILENGLDTHILNHENGDLKLGTNDAEKMRISSAGHLGIGVTPADSFSFGKACDIGSTSGGFYYARDTDAGSDAVGGIGYSGSGLFIGNEKSDGFIRFSTNTSATERMRINSSGSVGIGTSSPAIST